MASVPLEDVRRTARAGLWLSLLALALLIGSGYLVFLGFARGFFEGASIPLVGVAAVAGAASFFSPCAFPFLPTYLSVQALRARDRGFAGVAGDGAVAGLGVVAFNGLLGVLVATAGAGFAGSLALLSPTPSPLTVGVRLTVASVLILVGLLQAFDRGTHGAIAARIARAFHRLAGVGEGPRSLFLYGFAYTAIGIGCTGPFLASVVVLGFTAGGFGPALLAFLVFALTMAALMVAVALVAHARPRSARVLGEKATRLKRWAGAALVAFGVLLGLLTIFPTAFRPLFP